MSLKIEGTQRAKSHPSRTDRWNEDFELSVDKANEVEITIYDKQISEMYPVPIGMLWIRISDLVEAQRRQRVGQETGQQGEWVTAGAMAGGAGDSPPYGAYGGHGTSPGDMPINYTAPMPGAMSSPEQEGIEGWFSVEPAGAISLRLNFSKSHYPLDKIVFVEQRDSQGERTQTTTRCARTWPPRRR